MNHPLHRAFDPLADRAMELAKTIDDLKIDVPFSTVQFAECWITVLALRDALHAFAESVRSVR